MLKSLVKQRTKLILWSFISLASCNYQESTKLPESTPEFFSDSLQGVSLQKYEDWKNIGTIPEDTNKIVFLDSTEIDGEWYKTFMREDGIITIINESTDTLFSKDMGVSGAEFKDVNQDGFADVVFQHMGNVFYSELLLFEPVKKNFEVVMGFSDFPEAKKIGVTNLYYSYHRSGCADTNWDSDLFYIKNFKAVRIGNISGRECSDLSEEEEGIFISKVKGEKLIFYHKMKLSALGVEDYKWGFIKSYWKKNWKKFTTN